MNLNPFKRKPKPLFTVEPPDKDGVVRMECNHCGNRVAVGKTFIGYVRSGYECEACTNQVKVMARLRGYELSGFLSQSMTVYTKPDP